MSLRYLGLIGSSPSHSASFPCHPWSSLTSIFPTCPAYSTPHIAVLALHSKSTVQAPLLSESSPHRIPPPHLIKLCPIVTTRGTGQLTHIVTFFHLLNVSFMSALSLLPGSKSPRTRSCFMYIKQYEFRICFFTDGTSKMDGIPLGLDGHLLL